MCLVFLNHDQHPRYRLVMAANRDEFYDRPTAPAHFWKESPRLLAGKDLKNGGTWMGITRSGRFAALTNFRDPASVRSDAPSRGALVSDFLSDTVSPERYLNRIRRDAPGYNGFNLLTGDASGIWYYENRTGTLEHLQAGVYGLSNRFLDTPWPKVEKGKRAFRSLCASESIDPEALFHLLADAQQAPDGDLPDTGVGLKWERMLLSRFITGAIYGTRSSGILLMDRNGETMFAERTWVPGQPGPVEAFTRSFRFTLQERPNGGPPPSLPAR